MTMNASYKKLCDFMWFAFLPSLSKAEEKAAFYRTILTDDGVDCFDPASPASARDLAVRIFRDRFEETGTEKLRLGVTSGMDSRGLLGVALEVLPPENIIAYTTGQKGNRDIERPRYFTDHVLPTHFLIETQGGTYDVDDWIKRFQARPEGTAGTLYGMKTQLTNPLKPYSSYPSMSGFLGDATSGKRLHGVWHDSWQDALAAFAKKNEVFRPSTKRLVQTMVPEDYDPFSVLPKAPLLPQEIMGYDDQLDMCYRQHQRIGINFIGDGGTAQHQSVRKGIITIYNDPRWQKSYLTMAPEERLGQAHYHRMLKENWPRIFDDLVHPEDPRYAPEPEPKTPEEKLERSARTALHTNWELLWTKNAQFNDFARGLLSDLAERDVLYWLDVKGLIEEFDKNILGLGKMLWCLCSVELNLRSGNIPVPERS